MGQAIRDDERKVITSDDLYDQCLEYLTDRHTILWGRSFDLVQRDSRETAAEWLATQIEAVFNQ